MTIHKPKSVLLLLATGLLSVGNANADCGSEAIFDIGGTVESCDGFFCGLAGISVGDPATGFFGADAGAAAPNSTFTATDITDHAFATGGIALAPPDSIVDAASLTTDPIGEISNGTLGMDGSFDAGGAHGSIPITVNLDAGAHSFLIETDYLGLGVVVTGSAAVARSPDTDGDGEPDFCDPDDDGDGIADALDDQPLIESNECTGGDEDDATLQATIVAARTCAARKTVKVLSGTTVQPPGQLTLISTAVSIADGFGASSLEVITADPCPNCTTPGAPVITTPPVTTATEGEPYAYDVDAVDPDGHPLTFSLVFAPAGMSIDAGTGLLQWTATAMQIGGHAVSVRATDPLGFFATQVFTIDVVPNPAFDYLRPVVTLGVTPGNTVGVTSIITLSVTATDDTGVSAIALSIDGADVPLDAAGTATFTSATPGTFEVLATAVDTEGNEGAATETLRFLEAGDVTPPTAVITVPTDDAVVTAPVDVIGTADDDTALLAYRLRVSPAGRNQFFTIDAGDSPVVNGVLGQLDPSILRNGAYDLQLQVEDTAGNTLTTTTIVQVEGNLKVGNLTLSITDLEIPASGIPITIRRNFDSRRRTSGDFGFGWGLGPHDIRVDENGLLGDGWQQTVSGGFFPTYSLVPTRQHRVTVTFSDGSTDSFGMAVTPNSRQLIPFGVTDPITAQFPANPGTGSILAPLDGTQMFLSVGSVGPFSFLDDFPGLGNVYDPTRYRITGHDGVKFDVNQLTGIERVIDRNGNTLTYGPGGILHSSSLSVVFTRDAQNRITSITDPLGNSYSYEYDSYGDLVASTDAIGNKTLYLYDHAHDLAGIVDPLGNVTAYDYDDGRLIAIVDAAGNRVEYLHDIMSRQEIVTDRNGNVTTFSYDERGNITARTDALGNTTTFGYDANDNQTSRTDPLGNVTTRTYDASGNVLSETNELGQTTTFTYNAASDVLTVTDPLGNVVSRSYDASGNLLSETDALGGVTTYSYDANGNVLARTDALGNTTTFVYDFRGRPTSVTDGLGNVTSYTYDANGNQLSETRSRTLTGGSIETLTTIRVYDALNRVEQEVDALGNPREMHYDANGNLTDEIDPLGRVMSHGYDARGNRVRTTHPDGTTQTFVYDPENRLIQSTDREGRGTIFAYDGLGRVTQTMYDDGSSSGQAYDVLGRPISAIDERGNTTTYVYDAAGNRTAVTDALGNTTTHAYDAVGNRIGVTDARGNSTGFEYDANGNRTAVVDPVGGRSEFSYDALGRRVADRDAAGNLTSFAYDALDRLITTTDALGNVTEFAWDEIGNRLARTDANGNVESWTHDALGRILTHTLPLGQDEHFTYDAVGNVLSREDFAGFETIFVYDVDDRLTEKTFADSSSESYSYTAVGKIDNVNDPRGATTYTYDDRDRLLVRTDPDGEVMSYSYDAAGNRTAVTTSVGTTSFSYDALNRLATVTDSAGGITSYSYDAVGNRSALVYPNGTETTYAYDDANRLLSLQNADGTGAVLSSYDYTLDAAGKRLSVTEHDGRQVDYQYDALDRLIGETITDPSAAVTAVDYGYDAVGNRLTRVENGVATVHSYDANDRLVNAGASTYGYDDNGNRISGPGSTTYNYDFENRLVEATATDNVQYEYDALGNRVSRTVNGTRGRFLVDTNGNRSRVLAELDAAGAPLAVYTGGGELIAQQRGAIRSFYLYDGGGSTRALTDAAATVTDTYTYDAFGRLLGRTGATGNDFLYTGEAFEADLGLYYLRGRYLDPSAGRFLTRDSCSGDASDPPSLHDYSYATNDPVNAAVPGAGSSTIRACTALSRHSIPARSGAPRRAAGTVQGGAIRELFRFLHPQSGKLPGFP